MTEADLFDLLRPWVLAATGLPECIRDHPGAPRPAGAYAMLNLISSRSAHPPLREELVATGADPEDGAPFLSRPVTEWERTVSVNIYGTDAFDRMERLRAWTETAAGLMLLGPATISRVSDVRRLPELVGSVWEGRAQMDIDIRGVTAIGTGAPVDVAERVIVEIGAPRTTALPDDPMPPCAPLGTAEALKP